MSSRLFFSSLGRSPLSGGVFGKKFASSPVSKLHLGRLSLSSSRIGNFHQLSPQAIAFGPGSRRMYSSSSPSTIIDVQNFSSTLQETIKEATAHGLSEFKLFGLSDPYSVFGLAQIAIENFHLTLGTPWWASLIIYGGLLRCALVPLVYLELYQKEKVLPFKATYEQESKAIMQLRKDQKYDEAKAKQKELDELKKSRGHWSDSKRVLVTLASLPFVLPNFFAISMITRSQVPSFTTGGLLWAPDLTLPDIFLILPIIYVATAMLDVSLRNRFFTESSSNVQGVLLKYVWVAAFPLLLGMPAGTVIFIISTRMFYLITSLGFYTQAFRRLFGLPSVPQDRQIKRVLLEMFKLQGKHFPTDIRKASAQSIGMIDGFFNPASSKLSRWYYDRYLSKKSGGNFKVYTINTPTPRPAPVPRQPVVTAAKSLKI